MTKVLNKCRCSSTIPQGRLDLGYTNCVNCSSVQAYGCAPITNHKTGNSIQILSADDSAKIRKMTRRNGYGTMLRNISS